MLAHTLHGAEPARPRVAGPPADRPQGDGDEPDSAAVQAGPADASDEASPT
jgi:hypothetical protein